MDDNHVILIGLDESTCFVAVQGKATALMCTALRQQVLAALDGGARRLRVDLRNCQYGDSTFLGTLLQFRHACGPLGEQAFALLAPTPELSATLRSMGLARLFVVTEEPLPDGIRWQTLPREEVGRCSVDFQHNVVAAHRLLADSSETCRIRYEGIVAAAEQELVRRGVTTDA